MPNEENYRLRWQCRRGMLELDILLERFVELGYADLNAQEKATFNRLLEVQDPQLHAWLLGHESPQDPALLAIVKRIQAIH